MYAQILPFQTKQKKRIREDFLTKALAIARQLNRQEMTDAECSVAFGDLGTLDIKENRHD